MASPSNLNLDLIPFENPENLFELPAVMFIDPCGITHLAYPLMEEASIQGERRNPSLGSDLGDKTIARSEGEQISSKEQAHSSCDDDDDIPLVQLVSKRLCSRLRQNSCRPIAMILPDAHESLISNPSVKALVRVTRSVQRTRDAMLLAKSTKITRLVQKWQIQTIKDVLGVVNHETIPATKRGENAPKQRLRASLTAKNEEITALQVSHAAAIDKLHIDYGLKHDRLAEENSRLKEELAQTQAALNTERLSNSDRLKHLYELLTKDFSSSSSALPPSI
uniref:Uncharacterized protein n=1 Tax=Solanum tuberosum TaxID=4113 RepID=M1E1E3_SOLTU